MSAAAGEKAGAGRALRVFLWMLGSLLSFAVVALSVRGLQGAMTVFEMLALRNIGGILILAGMMWLAPDPDQKEWPVTSRCISCATPPISSVRRSGSTG